MKNLSMTLSSAEVALVDGKGAVTASVNNGGPQAERVVLGAFASGASPGTPAHAGAVPGTGPAAVPAAPPVPGTPPVPAVPATAAAATPAAPPTWTTIDRPLRTIAPGATEQYEIRFDTTGAVPGTYPVKLIPYSADEAPEDYADLAHVVSLVVPAPTEPVVPKKKFPWWIPVAAAVLVLAVGAVVFFLLRPDPPPDVALTGYSPTSGVVTETTQVQLRGRFAEPTVVTVGETNVPATRVSDTEYTFTMPPGSAPGQVPLQFTSGGVKLNTLAFFEYTPAPQPSEPPEPPEPPDGNGGGGIVIPPCVQDGSCVFVEPRVEIPRPWVDEVRPDEIELGRIYRLEDFQLER
jgi:IPT/TIG domain